jgi:NADH dehydrogenase FAD-containing subunit
VSHRPRVVIAGLGDTGLLTAIQLARHADVVGISTKPGLVSGQELGLRLARPHDWKRSYWVGFDRFRQLDSMQVIHGSVTGLDADERAVQVRAADGSSRDEPYDVFVISTGVANGFWRTPVVQDDDEIAHGLGTAHAQLASAGSVMVLGGGAAAVSSAWNVATTWPDKRVDLYFPGADALPHHHPRVWRTLRRRFEERGVGLHGGHRAVVPDGFRGDQITRDPVAWSTGQPASSADAVLWAIGRVNPNTDWVPKELLDSDGFVVVDEYLRVPGVAGVYAVGDVAATDPLRTSARARADRLLARNIRADLGHGAPKRFRPLPRRRGSVVGVQDNRLEVFSPSGGAWTIPAWDQLWPWLVARSIYKGIRPERKAPR